MTNSNFRPTRVGGPLPDRTEPRSVGMGAGNTRGHLATEGGLRGHSVDAESFPWRVVGVGPNWEVHDTSGKCEVRCQGDDAGCYKAHALARAYKVLYPGGYVEETGKGPANIGQLWDAAERLSCLRFTLRFADTGEVHRFRAAARQDHPGCVLVHSADTKVTHINLHWLMTDQNVSLTLDVDQFEREPKVELFP